MNSLIESDQLPSINMDTHVKPFIELNSVSVRYRVPQERFGTFKEFIIRRIQRKVNYRDFWALNDVNLTNLKGQKS